MINVLIFGGRDFTDYQLLKTKCDEILKDVTDDITIISGHALGADIQGEKYASEKGYDIDIHVARWNDLEAIPCRIKYNKYGKAYNCLAGMNRNKDMVQVSDIAIGFWDGKSKGTANSIDLCNKKGIRIEIINY